MIHSGYVYYLNIILGTQYNNWHIVLVQSSKELLFNRQKRRPFVEVPHPLRLEILEEAHQIVTKTLQSTITLPQYSGIELLHSRHD